MTPQQSKIWNAAIDAALRAYGSGRGAIKALRIPMPATIEHAPLTTEVAVESSRNNN